MKNKDKLHMGRVAALGCALCNKLGYGPTPAQVSAEPVWMPIPSWSGLYEASCCGKIRSVKRPVFTTIGIAMKGGNELSLFEKENGYFAATLSIVADSQQIRKQCLVHRLVADAFLGKCPDGFQVCHSNGVRSDNRISNLRYDTVSGNHADKILHGTDQKGEKNPRSLLKESDVIFIRTSGLPIPLLAKKFSVSDGCISKAKYKMTWRHLP